MRIIQCAARIATRVLTVSLKAPTKSIGMLIIQMLMKRAMGRPAHR